jgi:hydrogenase large subunit
MVRLMKYVEFMKKVVPLHDDLFDFFYEALPGYEKVGQRRILLGCWGSFQDPDVCDYKYRNMDRWGKAMYVTPGVIVDGELVTNNLVDINLGIRILLGSSYYDGWENGEMFVRRDPLGNPVDRDHPWNQTTTPRPQKRDFKANYSWVMSPRWFDKRTGDYLALDTGGGPIARFWATALAGIALRFICPRLQVSRKWSSNGRFRSGVMPLKGTAPALISRLILPLLRSILLNRL